MPNPQPSIRQSYTVAGNSQVLRVAGDLDNYVDDCAGYDGDQVRDNAEVNAKLCPQHRQNEEDADQDE